MQFERPLTRKLTFKNHRWEAAMCPIKTLDHWIIFDSESLLIR